MSGEKHLGNTRPRHSSTKRKLPRFLFIDWLEFDFLLSVTATGSTTGAAGGSEAVASTHFAFLHSHQFALQPSVSSLLLHFSSHNFNGTRLFIFVWCHLCFLANLDGFEAWKPLITASHLRQKCYFSKPADAHCIHSAIGWLMPVQNVPLLELRCRGMAFKTVSGCLRYFVWRRTQFYRAVLAVSESFRSTPAASA